jgi:hypothetical protein
MEKGGGGAFPHRWKGALYLTCRLFDDYAHIFGEVRAAALLALAGMKVRFY